MEQKLRESEAYYKAIFEYSGTAIAILDEEGSIAMANSPCESMFGVTTDEVCGKKSWAEFVAEDQREIVKAKYRERMIGSNRLPSCYEVPIVTRDSSIRHVIMNVVSIQQTGKTVVSFTDITDRKQDHEELQKAYRQLQEMQAQLVHSARLAVVGQLASGVAHEIRNPLAIIIQSVDYLQSLLSSEPEVEAVQMIREASWRADKIVKDLLRLSGQSTFTLTKSDIRPLVEEVLVLISGQLKCTKIKIVTQYEEDLPDVRIDVNQMKQALINMVMNSIDAIMPLGEGTIMITAERNGQEKVRLVIADTGTGISDDLLDRIFDPFFTTKRKEKSVGLGLSTAQHIIERHNGRIRAEHNQGKGLRLVVDLPAVRN
ncbi:MAG: Sporulation kinase E [Syntrophorhabdaceae bacterium PtaU1.Bin034]|nr:MAG: Sporulation kinase E [Syntrophorhabdaceae bacterium PtaU1.Bin034]